jgi:hypothetical protein
MRCTGEEMSLKNVARHGFKSRVEKWLHANADLQRLPHITAPEPSEQKLGARPTFLGT